ncbi:LSU ribosomal protein L23p (L23Ae) [Alkalibacterium sp. AK22]|uniref:50S ribosomal protein L23 n=1 Tax=Alkalibacterium sp. AK22 TaxID=1229520 RepID=UPI00044E15B2|nr:50S ribosomal protein L23 [Alkalibacterium sp. AK22]EXJ23823.1 LSU ribosomal protein L23p (L23Ae) [Alkalibacterium sp. AK22]
MDARDVILRPIITEASMYAMDDKKYTFEVDVRAKKPAIKKAVEEIFDVKVDKVNVLNTARKPKRMGRYEGLTKQRRKAIVTLTQDSNDIALFGDEE